MRCPRRLPYTADQIDADLRHLIDATGGILATGARVGAIADLKRHQVNLALGVINFDEWSEPESNKGLPILPITGPLWEILERLVVDALPSGHLIHYRRKPIADGARNFFQTIRRLGTRAGIASTDAAPVNHYSIRRTWADFLSSHVPATALSQAMGHQRIGRDDQRRLFEAGSPTTEIYKRRKLASVDQVGEAIEAAWWPLIQPHTTHHLGSVKREFHAKILSDLEEA